MKKALTLSITIITSILTIGLLSNPSISSTAADISLVNKVFAQEQVFIAPGAFDPNNDEAYVPPQLGVPIGTSVSWANDDSTEHTVTADDGSFDSGPISPGDTFDNTFDSPGEFSYHCSIHPFMTGVVVVE